MLLRLKIILFICVFPNLSFAINDDQFNKIKDLIEQQNIEKS